MPTTHQTDDINIYKINIIKRKKIEKKERNPLPRIRSQIQKAIGHPMIHGREFAPSSINLIKGL